MKSRSYLVRPCGSFDMNGVKALPVFLISLLAFVVLSSLGEAREPGSLGLRVSQTAGWPFVIPAI